MKSRIAGGFQMVQILCTALGAATAAMAAEPQRPPAVPLVACDPYFSVWSMTDRLTDGPTRHWTGRPHRLTSLARVDGLAYRLMGDEPQSLPAARQVSVTVLPTRTLYEFDAGGVRLTLTFMTPLLPDDLSVCSRPVTYVTWTARSAEGPRDVAVYLDAGAELAVNSPEQLVTHARGDAGPLTTLRTGTVDQPILESRGDDQRIDWGHFYLASDAKDAAVVPATAGRAAFARGAPSLPSADVSAHAPAADAPVLAMAFPLGKVAGEAKSARAILAYDDVASIRYFNHDLVGYWRKDGATFDDLIRTADREYESLAARCEAFDAELVADMRKIGGDAYVQLGVLSWRQALAAQKICADANGRPLSFSKENNSNGCIATVDVLYPASPQMLAFSPNLLKASLVPLLDYSSSDRWTHPNAPHDLGTYPHATGQVYGGGDSNGGMPVEESGNMLAMLAALAKVEGNAEFSRKYWPVLTKWADYLRDKGLDPENQLTTDDFAGHIARNANLSAKAIMGIASYARLAEMLGHRDVADAYMATAREYARQWTGMADDGDHYALVFGEQGKGTWSQKYNLVWDRLLGFDVFPPEVVRKELAYYRTKMNPYGLPLDSRQAYTKLDWQLWTATMADDDADFRMIVDACAKWANETGDRIPLTDWYDTKTGRQSGFKARSVVGGVFIPFLRDGATWAKYASRDTAELSNWAATDFSKPQFRTIVAAGDTEPATWRYTTATPAGPWTTIGYDDATWQSGRSGFGTDGTPGGKVNTRWDSGEIYLRRQFTLPAGELSNVRLYLHHDEDAEVYINGVLAARRHGFVAEYVLVRITDQARATLKSGANTIAIRCRQSTGGQYVDAGIVEMVSGVAAAR